jgi:hypothetical protein
VRQQQRHRLSHLWVQGLQNFRGLRRDLDDLGGGIGREIGWEDPQVAKLAIEPERAAHARPSDQPRHLADEVLPDLLG